MWLEFQESSAKEDLHGFYLKTHFVFSLTRSLSALLIFPKWLWQHKSIVNVNLRYLYCVMYTFLSEITYILPTSFHRTYYFIFCFAWLFLCVTLWHTKEIGSARYKQGINSNMWHKILSNVYSKVKYFPSRTVLRKYKHHLLDSMR